MLRKLFSTARESKDWSDEELMSLADQVRKGRFDDNHADESIVNDTDIGGNGNEQSPLPSLGNYLPDDLMDRQQIGKAFNYSDAWIDSTYVRYPERLPFVKVGNKRMWSRKIVEEFLQWRDSASIDNPTGKSTTNSGVKSSPLASYATITEAAERLGISASQLRTAVINGEVDHFVVANARLLFIPQVLDWSRGIRSDANFVPFESGEWMPMKHAMLHLGYTVEDYVAMNQSVSKACARGLIQSKALGNLRLIKVDDFEMWLLERGDS